VVGGEVLTDVVAGAALVVVVGPVLTLEDELLQPPSAAPARTQPASRRSGRRMTATLGRYGSAQG
jgi:hypothetical protein